MCMKFNSTMIRDAERSDAEAIARIYNHYIEKTVITFEEVSISVEDMCSRIVETTQSLAWYVFEIEGRVVGYAYASKWKGRCAYRYSVESTVYLDPDVVGKGVGSKLYSRLLDALKEKSYHAVIAGIAIPNEGSVALHEKFGFIKVAHFKETGWKFDRWIDVGYWQLLL